MPAAKVDVPNIPASATKPGYRYVTVPETDLFDQVHPPIRINIHSFGPGTHYLQDDIADTVEERLKAYAKANVRILQPKKDLEAEYQVSKGQGNAGVATTGF